MSQLVEALVSRSKWVKDLQFGPCGIHVRKRPPTSNRRLDRFCFEAASAGACDVVLRRGSRREILVARATCLPKKTQRESSLCKILAKEGNTTTSTRESKKCRCINLAATALGW